MSKAERTRQFIIETTSPLFNKKGYFGTSMQEITELTGLTKGSIYGNFKNKDELAIEAFKYNLFLLSNEILQKISGGNHAIDKLLTFTEFYRKNYIKLFERGGCAILNSGTDADDHHPQIKEEVKKSLLSWKSILEKIIDEGMKKNEIKTTDPAKFSSLFIALVEGSVFLAKTIGSTTSMENNLDFLESEIHKLRI